MLTGWEPMTPTSSNLNRGERGRVTLQVIADKLSVSTATVSLALRDAPVVADVTRSKVQKLAREMGYVYNRSAASLRTARSNMLAVGFHDITNPYFSEMLSAIEETATASGRTILLGTYAESTERQDRVLSTMREYRPDGMLLCPAAGTDATTYDHLIAAGIPIVHVSREIEGIGLDFVGSDDARGTAMALEHLQGLGHRRIALVGGNDQISTGRARHKAYRETLTRLGLDYDPALVFEGFGTRETGLAGIEHLLALKDRPTAAVCFNDLAAFSVVGCDDVQEAALWYPALTTIRNHTAEMGRQAADLLIKRIAEPAGTPSHIMIAPELVVRGTTARPR
jgi:LacI family transcriptional regulator